MNRRDYITKSTHTYDTSEGNRAHKMLSAAPRETNHDPSWNTWRSDSPESLLDGLPEKLAEWTAEQRTLRSRTSLEQNLCQQEQGGAVRYD